MTSKNIITAALMVAIATPVMAQDISGASVTGTYRQYTDDDLDSSVSALRAGVEVGLGTSFALGGNFAVADGDDVGGGVTNVTAHGMYMFSPGSALGLFAATDSDDDIDATTYGIEIGGAAGGTQYEAYYGVVDSDDFDDDLSIAGFSIAFPVSAAFALGLDYSSFTVEDGFLAPGATSADDLTFSDTAIFARYNFTPEASVFAEIGQISASARSGDTVFVSVSELEYFAVGATYTFGRTGGNIFSDRSYVGFGS